jgi:tape measure domain-containing protein
MADIVASRIVIPVTTNAGKATVQMNKFDKSLENVEDQTNKTSKSFDILKKASVGLIAAFGVRELAKVADTYTGITNKLRLVTNGTVELTKKQEELFQVSQESRSEFESTVELYARLSRSTRGLGTNSTDLLKVTKAINKAFIVSGAGAEEASNAIRQLSQGLAAGALRGDEFNSVTEQAPRLAEAVAKSLKVEQGELRKLAAEGKITSATIIKALTEQASVIDKEYGQLAPTIGQALTTIENSFIRLIGVGDQTTGISATIANAFISLSKVLDFLADNFDILIIAIKTYTAIKLAPIILKAASNFIGLAEGIGGAAKSFRVLTAAIKANPIGFLAGAIVGAISLLKKLNKEFKELSEVGKIAKVEQTFQKLDDVTANLRFSQQQLSDTTKLNATQQKVYAQALQTSTRQLIPTIQAVIKYNQVSRDQKARLQELVNEFGDRLPESLRKSIANLKLIEDGNKKAGDSFEDLNKKGKNFAEEYKKGLDLLAGANVLGAQIKLLEDGFAEQQRIVQAAGLRTSELTKFQNQQRLNVYREFFKKITDEENLSFSERESALENQRAAILEADNLTNEQRLAAQQAYNEQSKALEQQRIQSFANTVQQFGSLAGETVGIFQNLAQVQQNLGEQEIQRLEEQGASQEVIEAKRRQLARKAAQDQKKFGRFSIVIDTATAIANALTVKPFPLGVALAGLAAAKGATQLAVNESTPIPSAQFGGSFEVPAGNAADSGLVNVNQNERVTVTPVGQSGEGKELITVVIDGQQFDAYMVKSMNKNMNNGKVQSRRTGVIKTA